MTWKPGPNAPLGVANGNPALCDTTPIVPIGTIREFYDDTQGPAEFIYLPGVVNLVSGDIVVYDLTPGAQAVTRHVAVTFKNTGRPIAIAVGAPQAGQYGWYQIRGVAIANAVAGAAAGAPVYGSATTGSIATAAAAGDQILNARAVTAVGTPAAGKAYVQVNDPCVQSQIT